MTTISLAALAIVLSDAADESPQSNNQRSSSGRAALPENRTLTLQISAFAEQAAAHLSQFALKLRER
jgi:hypothetical protein